MVDKDQKIPLWEGQHPWQQQSNISGQHCVNRVQEMCLNVALRYPQYVSIHYHHHYYFKILLTVAVANTKLSTGYSGEYQNKMADQWRIFCPLRNVFCLFSDTLWLEVAIILFFFFIQGGPKKAHIQQHYQQLRLIRPVIKNKFTFERDNVSLGVKPPPP